MASTHLRQLLVIDSAKDAPCGALTVSSQTSSFARHQPRQIIFAKIDQGTRPEYAPCRHHKVAHTLPMVIIADNHLHHQHRSIVTAITDRGQRQCQENLLLLLLATSRNFKKKFWV
jgi:hypothetical protein